MREHGLSVRGEERRSEIGRVPVCVCTHLIQAVSGQEPLRWEEAEREPHRDEVPQDVPDWIQRGFE